MVSHLMPFIEDTLVKVGILAHVVAHHKESSLDAMFFEYIKNERSGFGDWAVIESQVNCPFVTVHSP